MITINQEEALLAVNVLGELALPDYEEFESAVLDEHHKGKLVNLLLDLTEMSGFTVDVAWEDIRFVSQHGHDFKRIAIVSDDQWLSWLSWINAAFTTGEVSLFKSVDEARAWLTETD